MDILAATPQRGLKRFQGATARVCFSSHWDQLEYRVQSPCRCQSIDLYLHPPPTPPSSISTLHSAQSTSIPALTRRWHQGRRERGSTLNTPHTYSNTLDSSSAGLINLARNACEQSYHSHPDVPQPVCLHTPSTHTDTFIPYSLFRICCGMWPGIC